MIKARQPHKLPRWKLTLSGRIAQQQDGILTMSRSGYGSVLRGATLGPASRGRSLKSEWLKTDQSIPFHQWLETRLSQ